MKVQVLVLIATLFASLSAKAQSDTLVVELQEEMEAQGIRVAYLMNSAANEVYAKAQIVGGERVLEQGHTFSKTEIVASLYITIDRRQNNYPNAYVVADHGSRGLSYEAAVDLLDAAWAYDVALAMKDSFALKLTCRRSDGQGMDPAIRCGFSR